MSRRFPVVAIVSLLAAAPAFAADPPEWTATADLSYVKTGGNAEASTLGFKGNVAYKWDKNRLFLVAGGIRSSSSTISYFAVGPTDADSSVTRVSLSQKTAENYLVDGGYDRTLSDRLYATVGAGFERNVFAGVDSRVNVRTGAGYTWSAADVHAFKTALLVSLTHQSEVVPDPSTDDTFIGLRFTADFASTFGPDGRNTFKSLAVADENLQTTADFRLKWLNTFAVAMSRKLALQVGYLAMFDNMPALYAAPRYLSAIDGVPVPPATGSVLVPLKKWDTQFTVSVVVNLTPKPPKPANNCPCP
jgi:hypothetical protein